MPKIMIAVRVFDDGSWESRGSSSETFEESLEKLGCYEERSPVETFMLTADPEEES